MFKYYIADESGVPVDIQPGLTGKPTLITESGSHIYGSFKAVTHALASAVTIAYPPLRGSIQITDLIVSSKKANNETVTLRFTDDTVDIDIAVFEITTQLNEAISFRGHWQGWKNARLELELSSAIACTVACGYLKIPPELTLSYSAWNAER